MPKDKQNPGFCGIFEVRRQAVSIKAETDIALERWTKGNVGENICLIIGEIFPEYDGQVARRLRQDLGAKQGQLNKILATLQSALKFDGITQVEITPEQFAKAKTVADLIELYKARLRLEDWPE